jgi:2'-5' RNA ligase
MRVFIAIDLPEEIKQEVEKIQNKLLGFDGKKTEIENLHLTLKFLGELSTGEVEKVRAELKKINFKEFEAEVDSIGVFKENFIRIVWLHLSNCDELQKQVDDSLKEMFAKENRFMSHVTIARVKNVENKENFIAELKKIKIEKMRFRVKEFILKESILREKPEYMDIEKYRFER